MPSMPTPLPTPPPDADCEEYIYCGQCVTAPSSKQCHWCEVSIVDMVFLSVSYVCLFLFCFHQSSTLVGAGECRNGTTACQSQFPVDVMNGQTCPTAAPTPK